MPRTLYFFTNFYPFGMTTEHSFIPKELKYLRDKFEKIILIPRYQFTNVSNNYQQYPIDLEFCKHVARKNVHAIKLLFSEPVLSELVNLQVGGKIKRIRKLWWSLNTIQNVMDWLNQQKKTDVSAVFYTYWLTDVTVGLAMAKYKEYKNLNLISRAHGYDLYEERTSFQYFPLRDFTLQSLDRLFLISQNGLDYMKSKYPKHQKKFDLMKLGVDIPQSLQNGNGNEKILQIVSCSGLRPVKRIDLLCNAVHYFGESHNHWQIRWNHFGGGEPEEERRIQQVFNNMPANVKCCFWGQVPNQTVVNYYAKNYVDYFLSVSENEGIPVSMMEAMSFGIPVIATAVGGVSEIVTNENGYLLPANPTIEEISNAIWTAVLENNRNKAKRMMCRQMISEQYNAELNYPRFAEKVLSFLEP